MGLRALVTTRLAPAMLRPGDYFVVATGGFVATLIRWFTGSWANHCGVYVGAGQIIEANPAGVQMTSLSKYDGLHIAWSCVPLTEIERAQILGASYVLAGIPYGFLDVAAIVLRRWGVGGWADHRLDRGDRLICSQLVARAYRIAGRPLMPGVPDNYVTPGDLARLLAKEDRPS